MNFMKTDRARAMDAQRQIVRILIETTDIKRSEFCIMAMPAMKFIWFRGNVCSMYSKVAAGCDFVKNQDEEGIQCAFTGQFSPIAIELGGKNLRGFAELGFGAQGIAGIGVRYAF